MPLNQTRRFARRIAGLVGIVALVVSARADKAFSDQPELVAALRLLDAKRYPEACVALEKIVAADPKNAAACHHLGRALTARSDQAGYEEGVKWLAKAVELEPNNAVYQGIFGGSSLQLASRTNSLSAATRGRDAMEKALKLDPDYLAAREGLYQFYARAPWPLGNSGKAAAQLEEIRRRDPDLATVLSVMSEARGKHYDQAFRLCDDVLAKSPENYTALYYYGRTASVSGQNLERGLACLQKCLTLEPPRPASPSHSNVWHRIGNVLEQLGRRDEARAAYTSALKLDAGNTQATEALAKLK